MSESTTLARPYAKAIFEHALAENKLAQWSQYLDILALALLTPEAAQFISNPAPSTEQKAELLHSLFRTAGTDKAVENLINFVNYQ